MIELTKLCWSPEAGVQLLEVVEKIIELFLPPGEGSDIQLSYIGSGLVIGDRITIQRDISNQLSNAIPLQPTQHRRGDNRCQVQGIARDLAHQFR